MSSHPQEVSTPTRHAVAVGAVVGALPVPVLAPAVGGGVSAALVRAARRRNAVLGLAAGVLGGLGYFAGWVVLALFLAGTVPPELPDGGAFEAFAAFILVLDATAGAVGGLVGGGLARRVRRRSDAEAHAEAE